MSALPRKKAIPYKPIIVGALVAVVVTAAVIGTQRVKDAYATEARSYATHTVATLKQADQAISRANHNTKAIKTALEVADSRLKKLPHPEPPRMLGISLGRAADADKANAIRDSSQKLRQQLQAGIALLTYQQEVLEVIKPLAGAKADSADSLRVAGGQWVQAHDKLSAAKPPKKMEDFHGKLVSQTLIVGREIQKLPDLFNTQDVAGFIAQRQKMADEVAILRIAGDNLNNALKEQDTELGKAAIMVRSAAE